jgi:ornithine decarboxylase
MEALAMTPKIRALLDARPQTPCIVLDLDAAEAAWRGLARAFPGALIHYAVKANPAPALLRRLAGLGSGFDAASWAEIEACLAAGADPARISFGNTVKAADAVARAHASGVPLYAVDTEAELRKVARAAPGRGVYVRVAVENAGAAWPLAGKFGTTPEEAARLLRLSADLGLQAEGISFHVGSQQTEPSAYAAAIDRVARVFTALRAEGLAMRLLNLGGGFPIDFGAGIPAPEAFAAAAFEACRRHFGNDWPRLMIEPGRAVVGAAGVFVASVVLADRREPDGPRWVYLDAGRFQGLAETEGEAIAYALETSRDGDGAPLVETALAGPTCDGVDVLYRPGRYRLPDSLREGDRIVLRGAGAYTWTYAAFGFNGFAPPALHVV